MTKSIMRGALIVLEGCDRSGKTTQSTKLVEALNKLNIPAKKISFPDRSTPIGSIINDYLSRKIELPDRSVHLLFSANRWELESEIRKQIEAGVTLIVDRYSYSGVVFTSAKQCIDFKWCCGPENGLPKPDLVMFLKLSSEEMAKRSGFGDERYENVEFQNKVDKNYDRFTNENFIQINAAQDISTLTNNLLNKVLTTIDFVKNKELDELVFN
ncbi:P-loop containing nucleoside triphosphate hydrolase,Thymidylate kinase, conserved site,Thymidylate [Cinara cedri]|uniref:Thymidylate kinase n=1 Tax=Cinara cedri TaxID=506608 RepID=A0A5E4M4D4_9HEMI|nr:P-loop containing nucleoside triphosphate hydrolase,Thymidylate kinase, conserved site,Thymidylate [Cinara cedri]